MGSNIYATKCQNCGRSAIEDYYYRTGEYYTYCLRCGHYIEKTIESYTNDKVSYTEKINVGHGIFRVVNKDGSREGTLFETPPTDEQLEGFRETFFKDSVNQAKSYLVTYNDGEFKVLLGSPPANFYLSFEEYKEKMFAKYGKSEYDFMVPIEE